MHECMLSLIYLSVSWTPPTVHVWSCWSEGDNAEVSQNSVRTSEDPPGLMDQWNLLPFLFPMESPPHLSIPGRHILICAFWPGSEVKSQTPKPFQTNHVCTWASVKLDFMPAVMLMVKSQQLCVSTNPEPLHRSNPWTGSTGFTGYYWLPNMTDR